jgi:hypothetical protein
MSETQYFRNQSVSGALEEQTALENRVLFVPYRGFGTSFQIFMMLDRNPARVASADSPAFGRTLLMLSIVCLSPATALLGEESLDQIYGIESRP